LTPSIRRWGRHAVTLEDRWWIAADVTRRLASLGLSRVHCTRVSLCVAELVTNAVKFGTRAAVLVEAFPVACRAVRVVVEDDGPGIDDPTAALRDGWSEGRVLSADEPAHARRGLGVGLGAVSRLASRVEIARRAGGGARVTARVCANAACERCALGEHDDALFQARREVER
jgi:anti-sigma regulatory factor (Ser/Thr protein kinase)